MRKLSDGSASPAHSHARPIEGDTNGKLAIDTIDVEALRHSRRNHPMTALESAAR